MLVLCSCELLIFDPIIIFALKKSIPVPSQHERNGCQKGVAYFELQTLSWLLICLIKCAIFIFLSLHTQVTILNGRGEAKLVPQICSEKETGTGTTKFEEGMKEENLIYLHVNGAATQPLRDSHRERSRMPESEASQVRCL
jgi:hypothetical protein